MPVYEYQCKACGRDFEYQQRMTDPDKTTCEACGGSLDRLISRTAFALKGGGWYKDLYASPKPEGAKADSGDGAKSDGKADAKPAAKTDAPAGGAADKPAAKSDSGGSSGTGGGTSGGSSSGGSSSGPGGGSSSGSGGASGGSGPVTKAS
jgi:putative FmdB family regulatory protein